MKKTLTFKKGNNTHKCEFEGGMLSFNILRKSEQKKGFNLVKVKNIKDGE